MENMKGNRIVSLGDIERFISNFKCQKCQSLGSYIITKELFQWIDQSLNVTFQCQNCSMSLRLTESNIIEIKTPGCISKTISHNMLQLACAATEIGLSFSQIETLLQSLGIPTPTLSIWKTYVEIVNERNKSNISDPTYVKQINEVEQIGMEAPSHNLSSIKTEKPDAVVDIFSESNTVIIKEEPPEMDIKEELGGGTNDELFMEYNDEVIVPWQVPNSINHLSCQTANEGISDVIDADCLEVSSSYNIETIYIEDRTSRDFKSTKKSSEEENSYEWNVNAVKNKEIMKKRHVVTPKRYRDDFYCEDYRIKSSTNFVNKRSNNRHSVKNNLKMIRYLVSDSDADKKKENIFKANKKKEKDDSDSVNNENSMCNVEIITNSNFNRIKFACALCGSCKYSNSKQHYSSIIPGFGSITVKVAFQILNLTAKNPKCDHFCSSCFIYICTKFKYTLKKKIADQKNIDISEVKLSKIKVRTFDRLDKKKDKPENTSHTNETALSTSSITKQSPKVVKLNSNNEVKLKRKKYLTKKMSESLSQKRLKIPYLSLTKQLEKDAKSSHPMIRLMDVSLILPSEAFDGASVSVDRKSDILQFCRKRS